VDQRSWWNAIHAIKHVSVFLDFLCLNLLQTASSDIPNKGFLWGEDRSNTAFHTLSPAHSFPYVDDNLSINTTTTASQKSEIDQILDKNFSIYTISDTESSDTCSF
jgi:hypothetical protein